MSSIKVALLQIAACGNDQDANRSKGQIFCRRARGMGADIALFPELWNIGYTPYDADRKEAQEVWHAQAIERDDQFVTHFRQLAKELDMAIAVTYLEKWQGAPRNSVSIIDRRGRLVLTYAKVHTCDFLPVEASCTPGDDFCVCDVDTHKGSVRVGPMICYDREAPESARILMLKGAEILLTPNACKLDDLRIGQFRARAYENAVGVAMTNYPEPQRNGHSVAFDAEGSLVVEAGKNEGLYMAQFDIDAMRRYREKTVWGNAFRRPHRYGSLASYEVQEPFVRNNAFGERFDRTAR